MVETLEAARPITCDELKDKMVAKMRAAHDHAA
jgi:hypothetical protein